jgi:hypothetical protein
VKILRPGGEYLQAREARGWNALSILVLTVLAATITVMASIGRSTLFQTIAVLSAVCVLLSAKAALPKVLRQLRATQRGRLGERLTAQLVGGLSDDYYLINDIVLGRGNIDHVIVGPCGILAIETKRVGGAIHCDGDDWTVKGRSVRSYSKQVKAGAMAVKAVVGAIRPELRGEYVQAVVVLTDPHCRVTINRAQVGIVRFSELLPFITVLANKRRMNRAVVQSVVVALAGSWATGATGGSSRAT